MMTRLDFEKEWIQIEWIWDFNNLNFMISMILIENIYYNELRCKDFDIWILQFRGRGDLDQNCEI